MTSKKKTGKKARSKTSDKETKRQTRWLPVALDDARRLVIAAEASTMARDRDAAVLELKGIQTERKGHISELEGGIKLRLETLHKGTESGKVEVEATADYAKGRYYVKRMDDGEVVEERSLTPPEIQLGIKLVDEEKPKDGKDDKPPAKTKDELAAARKEKDKKPLAKGKGKS